MSKKRFIYKKQSSLCRTIEVVRYLNRREKIYRRFSKDLCQQYCFTRKNKDLNHRYLCFAYEDKYFSNDYLHFTHGIKDLSHRYLCFTYEDKYFSNRYLCMTDGMKDLSHTYILLYTQEQRFQP